MSRDRLCVRDLTIADHPLDLGAGEPFAVHVLLFVFAGRFAPSIRWPEYPAALAGHPGCDVELPYGDHRARVSNPVSSRSSRNASSVASSSALPGAVPWGELPTAFADRISELFDESETIAVRGDDQRIIRFVDDAVDAERAIRAANLVPRTIIQLFRYTSRDVIWLMRCTWQYGGPRR